MSYRAAADAPAAAPGEATGEVGAKSAATGVVRKIVYQAEVDLICEDLAPVGERLEALATAAGGFIADARLTGAAGEPRWGLWKLRVPTGRFDGLLAEIKRLAEVRSTRTTSDDVSEEYYDVEAHIRNKQQEETRLLRLLEDRTAELEDVLSVEREIARVRGDVERLQARMRVLNDLVDLATLTVRVDEVHGYQPESAASFPVRLARGIEQSAESLVTAIQTAIIALAMCLPWLAAMSVPLAPLLIVARRRLASRT